MSAVSCDFAVSNGVFLYFPDYDYAESVICNMLKIAKKGVGIFDVPDIALKEASENARRSRLPEGEYDKKYKNLHHLFYSREWFMKLAEKYNVSIKILPQRIRRYVNSDFRFNVFLTQ